MSLAFHLEYRIFPIFADAQALHSDFDWSHLQLRFRQRTRVLKISKPVVSTDVYSSAQVMSFQHPIRYFLQEKRQFFLGDFLRAVQ